MATKIWHRWKLYKKYSSLFQLVEEQFPFSSYIKKFNQQLPNSIRDAFIENELTRINSIYPSNALTGFQSKAHFGFLSKENGHDWPLAKLGLDFKLWQESKDGIIAKKIYTLEKNSPFALDEYLERMFFKQIAIGVNDALFKKHLQKLRASQNPFAHSKNLNPGAQSIQSIIKDGKVDKCIEAMKYLDIINEKNECLLKRGNGTKLYAFIHALNALPSDKTILKKDKYTEEELLRAFNSFLQRDYKKIKKDSKYFDGLKKEASDFLKK